MSSLRSLGCAFRGAGKGRCAFYLHPADNSMIACLHGLQPRPTNQKTWLTCSRSRNLAKTVLDQVGGPISRSLSSRDHRWRRSNHVITEIGCFVLGPFLLLALGTFDFAPRYLLSFEFALAVCGCYIVRRRRAAVRSRSECAASHHVAE